ncbi:Uncharacterised protein [Mycobacterium tuberculosis]|nr:Uncharacterised protein [Mycobacterium tuberculosis]
MQGVELLEGRIPTLAARRKLVFDSAVEQLDRILLSQREAVKLLVEKTLPLRGTLLCCGRLNPVLLTFFRRTVDRTRLLLPAANQNSLLQLLKEKLRPRIRSVQGKDDRCHMLAVLGGWTTAFTFVEVV